MVIDITDILVIENGSTIPVEYYKSIQRMINAGQWSMQGSVGRSMMAAIEDGYCMLGQHPAHDYWGNRIPSRDEVVAGTKGSAQFVADRCDEDWLKAMEEA